MKIHPSIRLSLNRIIDLVKPAKRWYNMAMSKGELTKRNLAKSFKKLMEEKSFESITVTDITSAIGLNRLTFYYHFKDKFDLLNWIYDNEIILPFRDNVNRIPWDDNLARVLATIQGNSAYYHNALAYDNGEFRRYMNEAVHDLFVEIIAEGVGDEYVEIDDIRFVSSFFSHGIVGMVVDWIEQGPSEEPREMMEQIKNLVEDIKMLAISRYLQGAFDPDISS